MTNNPSYGRREFLKDSAHSVAKAAHAFAAQHEAASTKVPAAFRSDWLRPPGAAEEAAFLERCSKCGDCLKACPPGAIAVHGQDGTPVIFADQAPCLLCEDLPCIAACATEALLPVSRPDEVRMGTAVLSERLCTSGQGCHACVSKCPTNALVLNLETLRLAILPEACVGCGMCEMVCKTVNDHVAIRVMPARLRGRMGR